MDAAFIESFVIAFVGAILFWLVDKYEPDGPMARLLKFLVLLFSRFEGLSANGSVRAWRKDRCAPALPQRAYLNSISLIVDCRHCLRYRFVTKWLLSRALRPEAQRAGPVAAGAPSHADTIASRLYRVCCPSQTRCQAQLYHKTRI